MRSSLAERPGGAVRLAGRLLLVLALAACGEGSDEAAKDPAKDQVADSRQPACTPPPVIDTMLFHGSYDALANRLRAAGVAYRNESADSTTALVELCDSCNAVKMRIVSEGRTYCTRADSLRQQTRIAGVFVVDSGTVNPGVGWGRSFGPGDSLLVFARDTLGSATLAYRMPATNGADRVGTAPTNAWKFRYCSDGHGGTAPQGRWRRYTPSLGATPTQSENERAYGWMACASGCCQFYVPPPGPDPDVGRRLESMPPGDEHPPCPGGA